MIDQRKRIAVYPPPDSEALGRLLGSLSAVFEVGFEPIASLDSLTHDAVLLLADSDASQLKKLSSFPAIYSAPPPSNKQECIAEYARFEDHEPVPNSFRRAALPCSLPQPIDQSRIFGFRTLVSAAGTPIWSTRIETDSTLHYRSALPVNGLTDATEIIDVLHEVNFLSLLPLVDFVRRLTQKDAWESPSLRATLILDDPNLHSGSYGNIDYETLARHAKIIGFHACMATVPLDGWFLSSRAAVIFKKNAAVLSLAVHGNNHEHRELARLVSQSEADRVIAQALRRIRKLEKDSGLAVSRVMVPPHGACSATFFNAMARSVFYGATTTRSAVWHYSTGQQRPVGGGMGLAEIVDGLPVIHRFRFKSDRHEHRIAVSAYLNHPLIAYGHHEDFSGGIDSFNPIAERINKLGAKWMNPEEVLDSNYETKSEGDTLWIRPYSRHIRVQLRAPFRRIAVDVSHYPTSPDEEVTFSVHGLPEVRVPARDAAAPFVLENGAVAEISMRSLSNFCAEDIPGRRTPALSLIRRILSEIRDRSARRSPKK